ncbi:hypothetical protein [Chitinophaga sp. OAE865]|uniref:hypothetical protein n=1 Tax=Chitinophaga sp. OAE865 TaxID=2817898 RepID=UPI001AE21777
MRKAVAIFLMALYLLGTTEAGQVLKLPLLVEHYIKHKGESPGTTIFSFFKMHYVDPQPYDADYQQDMELPFKTCLYFFTLTPPSILPVLPQLSFKVPAEAPVMRELMNDEIPPYLPLHSIFQPPRV